MEGGEEQEGSSGEPQLDSGLRMHASNECLKSSQGSVPRTSHHRYMMIHNLAHCLCGNCASYFLRM